MIDLDTSPSVSFLPLFEKCDTYHDVNDHYRKMRIWLEKNVGEAWKDWMNLGPTTDKFEQRGGPCFRTLMYFDRAEDATAFKLAFIDVLT